MKLNKYKIAIIVLLMIILFVLYQNRVVHRPPPPPPSPNPNHPIGGCAGTRYGCCPDGRTPRYNFAGTNCH